MEREQFWVQCRYAFTYQRFARRTNGGSLSTRCSRARTSGRALRPPWTWCPCEEGRSRDARHCEESRLYRGDEAIPVCPPVGFVPPALGLAILMGRGRTTDHKSGCHREEAARTASGRRGDPVVIGMASGSRRPASGGTRDDRALERDFLNNDKQGGDKPRPCAAVGPSNMRTYEHRSCL